MLIKNKKFAFLLVLSISVCIMLSACSSSDTANEKETPVKDNTPEVNSQAQDNTEKKADDLPKAIDPKINVSVGDGKSVSVKLPDSYPSDIFPLYKDCFIFSVVELSGGFTVTAYSKDDYKDIADFYKDILENAEDKLEMAMDIGFASFGSIGKFSYNITVGPSEELEGYVSTVVIILTPML